MIWQQKQQTLQQEYNRISKNRQRQSWKNLVSVFIDMTYRQVIANNGIPFSLKLGKTITTRDELSDTQFNSMMNAGLTQAKADQSKSVGEVFADLSNLSE